MSTEDTKSITDMEEQLFDEQSLVKTAKVVSNLFAPWSILFVSYLILFTCTYLHTLPLQYKLIVMGVIFCFTIFMPLVTIRSYFRINHLTPDMANERKHRFATLTMSITSFICCLVMIHRMNLPWYMTRMVWVMVLTLGSFILCNIKWRLSEHAAGTGIVIGYLVALSSTFSYNPVWWLCVFILIAGIIGTARIILQKHSLGEVIGGFTIGLTLSLLVLHPISNLLLLKLLLMIVGL